MPVVGVPIDALNDLIGRKIPAEELFTHLERLGNDVDGITQLKRFQCGKCRFIMELVETEETPGKCVSCQCDFVADATLLSELSPLEVIRLELLPVRPDLFDVGGLSRALKGYLDIETGLQHYPVTEGTYQVEVDPALSRPEAYRPAIACAVVRNLKLDDELIKTIMKMQENLHWALGRNRKHASIGVYDLDQVTPDFRYRAVGPTELEFTPLNGMPEGGMVAVTPRRILEDHPKGREFAHLLEDLERYPLLTDSRDRVLSAPPIINSQETRVTDKTRNLFVDVTGFSRTLVSKCLNIVVTGLYEIDSRIEIESVTIRYPGEDVVRTPDMTVEETELVPANAASLIGMDLSPEEVAEALRRMRFDVEGENGTSLKVRIPPYRTDILHEVDLIEDVALGYGFHRVGREICPTFTPGGEQVLEGSCSLIRRILAGLGFLETLSLMLTSPENHYHRLNLPDPGDAVTTHNPASTDQSLVRTHLLEGVLQSFSLSVGDSYPQRFFEIGDVVRVDASRETGTGECRRLTAGISSARAGYAEIRSAAEALFRELGVTVSFVPGEHRSLISGRTARLVVNHGDEDKAVGWVGEVHPEVLERFSIVQPVALMEMEVGTALAIPEVK